MNMIEVGYSTRCGGASRGSYASLNLAYHTGDRVLAVRENRRRFLSIWGLSPQHLVAGKQIHGTGIHRVEEGDRGRGNRKGTAIPRCDALITGVVGVVLAAFSADCMIVCLVNPQRRVAALAHAGWRGVLHGVVGKMVDALVSEYGGCPQELMAWGSPCICRHCLEVSPEVAVLFLDRGWDDPLFCDGDEIAGKYFLDLREIVRKQLITSGLPTGNIEMAEICTSCHPDLFYSYRREGEKTGRMMGFVTLKG